MKIDNFDLVLPFMQFSSEDDFYYLQILQRKKENPQLGSNSRVIKNYYIKSIDHLIKHKDEIVGLCEQFNARASLRLNKRSFEKVAFKTIVNVANSISNREYEFIKASYDRACGDGHNDKNKKWILDIDYREGISKENITLFIDQVTEFIANIEPVGLKQLAFIPSKSGYHIITSPFNLEKFKKQYPEIDVHKDNPTNIYIP